jgi:hypothetical protein
MRRVLLLLLVVAGLVGAWLLYDHVTRPGRLIADLDSTDDRRRGNAEVELGKHPDPRAIPASRAIARLHDRRAVEPIIRLIARYPSDRSLVPFRALAEIGGDEATMYLADRLMNEPTEYYRSELAALLAKSRDPHVTAAFDQAADKRQLEVVAGAFGYFLDRQPPVADELLVAAFHRYGGSAMSKALKQSGKPVLQQAVDEEERRPVKIPKTIEVQ